jgi:TrmH family RNA methyltransferase
MHLTSAANPRLKSIAALSRKKERAESGLFVVEGWEFVSAALRAGWKVETLIYEEGHAHPLLEKALAASAEVYTTTPALLGKLSGKDNPQPVIGAFRQCWQNIEIKNGFWIALDRPRDPGNVGSILRTADAAGAEGVLFIGESVDAYAPESVRATMGSVFNIALARMREVDFLTWRKIFAGPVIGTSLEGAVDYRSLPAERPALLVMGNEQQGLSPALAAACTHLAKIPMKGRAESLNLAAATAIAAFELNKA